MYALRFDDRCVRWIGIQPAVPWSLLPLLVLVVIPFALGATGAISLVAGHARPGLPMTRGRCALLGAMFLFAYRLDSALFLLGHVGLHVALAVVLQAMLRSLATSGHSSPSIWCAL
jgi:hypothetical protein